MKLVIGLSHQYDGVTPRSILMFKVAVLKWERRQTAVSVSVMQGSVATRFSCGELCRKSLLQIVC